MASTKSEGFFISDLSASKTCYKMPYVSNAARGSAVSPSSPIIACLFITAMVLWVSENAGVHTGVFNWPPLLLTWWQPSCSVSRIWF